MTGLLRIALLPVAALLLGALAPASGPPPGGPGAAPDSLGPVAAPGAAEVSEALEALASARRGLVLAEFAGDSTAMVAAAGAEAAADSLLERAAAAPETIRAMVWPDRVRWLSRALEARRGDWSAALVKALGGELPAPGSPSRGPAALAVALNVWAGQETEAEEQESAPADSVAEDALRIAAGERFRLRDEALYRLWALADADGDTVAALAWADSLVAAAPRSLRTPLVRLTRARALLAAGDPAAGVAEARLALPGADSAALRWFLARALLRLDFVREAAFQLETLIGNFGGDPLATDAYALRLRLVERDGELYLPVENRLDLLNALLARPESGALERMLAVADSAALTPPVREKAALLLGRFLYRAKRYPEAEPLLRDLAGTAAPAAGREANTLLARILRNTGRVKPMTRLYRELIEGGGVDGATAAWELAREMESLGRWKEAERVYGELIDTFPGSSRLRDARFRRGFTRVRLHRLRDAVDDFRTAFGLSDPGPEQEQAGFWLARTLTALGRPEEAREAARVGAWRSAPTDYYGVRLYRDYGFRPEVPAPPEGTPFAGGRGLESLADAAWPAPIRDAYLRGLDLARLGLAGEAKAEWGRAADLGRSLPTVVQSLALAAAVHDLYPEGVRWANQSLAVLPVAAGTRSGFERLAFPAAYYGTVTRAAAAHGTAPELVWAIMRQESLYDPLAVSRADARGLLQILPATLPRITAETGREPLPTEALFRPEVNVPLGVAFFAARRAEFDGALLPTLAGYNAGENKVRQWIALADGDTAEVFVECIGYPETYGYVRRIGWLAWVYRAYYASVDDPARNAPQAR